MLVNMLYWSRIGEGEELKAPRHASAAATRDHTWYIPNNNTILFIIIYLPTYLLLPFLLLIIFYPFLPLFNLII